MNLTTWVNTPLPADSAELNNHLQKLWNYVKERGDVQCIIEFAALNVLAGEKPVSNNPLYLSAYQAAQKACSIEVDSTTIG